MYRSLLHHCPKFLLNLSHDLMLLEQIKTLTKTDNYVIPILIGREDKPFSDFSPNLYPPVVGVTPLKCPYKYRNFHPIYFTTKGEWHCCNNRNRETIGCKFTELTDRDKREIEKGVLRYHTGHWGEIGRGFFTIYMGWKCCQAKSYSAKGCSSRKFTADEYRRFDTETVTFQERHTSFD